MVRCKPPVKSPALRPDGELPILRLKPLAQAIALLMVAGSAHGATAFSSGSVSYTHLTLPTIYSV